MTPEESAGSTKCRLVPHHLLRRILNMATSERVIACISVLWLTSMVGIWWLSHDVNTWNKPWLQQFRRAAVFPCMMANLVATYGAVAWGVLLLLRKLLYLQSHDQRTQR
jgi:hypothetical protein